MGLQFLYLQEHVGRRSEGGWLDLRTAPPVMLGFHQATPNAQDTSVYSHSLYMHIYIGTYTCIFRGYMYLQQIHV